MWWKNQACQRFVIQSSRYVPGTYLLLFGRIARDLSRSKDARLGRLRRLKDNVDKEANAVGLGLVNEVLNTVRQAMTFYHMPVSISTRLVVLRQAT